MPRMLPRSPVYVISKGRADCCLTARALLRDGVPFRLVIEPQEVDAYAVEFDPALFLVLPFSNLGLGGIPARNWVWEHAIDQGHAHHWILDDNIRAFYRRFQGLRVYCKAGPALAIPESFVDRYENIAVAGLEYKMFTPENVKKPHYYLNHRVYSCLLIRNDLSFRWRGRYNEDTDLCLQALTSGWCTVLFNAFLCDKIRTMTMRGGNADELYRGDGRLTMATSLERMWPGLVQVRRRYGRPQHVIDWSRFRTPLRLRGDVDLADIPAFDEDDLRVVAVRPPTHTRTRTLLAEHGRKERP